MAKKKERNILDELREAAKEAEKLPEWQKEFYEQLEAAGNCNNNSQSKTKTEEFTRFVHSELSKRKKHFEALEKKVMARMQAEQEKSQPKTGVVLVPLDWNKKDGWQDAAKRVIKALGGDNPIANDEFGEYIKPMTPEQMGKIKDFIDGAVGKSVDRKVKTSTKIGQFYQPISQEECYLSDLTEEQRGLLKEVYEAYERLPALDLQKKAYSQDSLRRMGATPDKQGIYWLTPELEESPIYQIVTDLVERKKKGDTDFSHNKKTLEDFLGR